tara:strand:- start:26284 stop:26427 length:144 start_codon:yes stop_codon:yes gene_type:complete
MKKIIAWCIKQYANLVEKLGMGVDSIAYGLTNHAFRMSKKAKALADA